MMESEFYELFLKTNWKIWFQSWVNTVEKEMGLSQICSLERKEDDKLIIILKYFC